MPPAAARKPELAVEPLIGARRVVRQLEASAFYQALETEGANGDRALTYVVGATELAAGAASEGALALRSDATRWAAAKSDGLAPLLEAGRTAAAASYSTYASFAWPAGKPLSEWLKDGPLAPLDALEIALQLAQALAALHECEGLARGLAPDRVFLERNELTWRARIAGPALSLSPLGWRQEIDAGRASAVAPELLGLVIRPIGESTDLFSLGAIFRDMLRGRAERGPGARGVSQALTRQRLSQPSPLVAARPSLPPLVDRIAQKLLQPLPEDRYRSALGLASDLSEAARRVRAGDSSDFLALDAESGLRPAYEDSFVGRDEELEILTRALSKARRGQLSAALVLGPAGSGKTALLREFSRRAQASGARVAYGCCDERGRSLPWQGLRTAFDDLARGLEAEPPAERERIFARIRESCADRARDLTLLSPYLARVAGLSQPAAVAFTASPGSAQGRASLLETAAMALAAAASAHAPLALAIDDLQWADGLFFDVLETIACSLESKYVVIMGCCRNDDLDGVERSRRWHQMEERGLSCLEIAMPLMGIEGLRELAARGLGVEPDRLPNGLVEFLFDRSVGEPLVAADILRFCAREGAICLSQPASSFNRALAPPGGELALGAALARRRVEALSADARAAIAFAAILGRAFRQRALERALDLSPEAIQAALEEAARARLIRPDGLGGYEFWHRPALEACLALGNVDKKASLHALAIRALEGAVPGESDFFALAEHAMLSGDAPAAASACAQAGDAARAAYDDEAALALYGAALRAGQETGSPRATQLALQAKIAEATFDLGRFGDSRAIFEAILDEAPTGLDEARWRIRIAECLQNEGHYVDSEDILQGALAALGAPPIGKAFWLGTLLDMARIPFLGLCRRAFPPSEQKAMAARVEVECLIRLWSAHAFHDGRPLFRISYRILAVALSLGTSRELAMAHQRLSLTYANFKRPRLDRALLHARAAFTCARAVSDHRLETSALLRMAAICGWTARPRQALEYAEQARELLEKTGNARDLGHAISFRCAALRALGDLEGALAAANQLIEHGARKGAPSDASTGHARAAEILACLGRAPEAEEHAERAAAAAEAYGTPFDLFQARKARGRARMLEGRYEEARAQFQAALRLLESKGRLFYRAYVHEAYSGWCEAFIKDESAWAKATRASSEMERLADLMQRSYVDARRFGDLGEILRVQGLLRVRQGRSRGAQRAFRASRKAFAAQERPLEAAMAELEAGLAIRSKSRWRGSELLRRALGAFQKCGAATLANRAAQALDEEFGRVRMPPNADVLGVERLASGILEISLASASSFSQREQVQSILDKANELFGAERAHLFICPEGEEALEPRFLLGREIPGVDINRPAAYAQGLMLRALAAGAPLIAASEEGGLFLGASPSTAPHLLSLLAAPIRLGGIAIGVLCLDCRAQKKAFGEADLALASAVAGQIGVAARMVRLAREEVRKKETQKETEIAAAAQALLLPPSDVVAFEGAKLAAYHRPAMVSGGDWWHYESLGPRRFRVYVADVTGRGADAALAAALMVGDIGGYAETGRPEADLTGVMQRAGERLHRVGANRFWMTMTVAELDLGAMTAAFWFASSPPVFIASRGDKKAQTIVEPGLPLGHHTSKVGYWQTALKKGDRILLFTDGATEQRMPGDMEIGLRRFQKIFMATLELDPREARAEIAKALAGHRGSRRQDDDVTFVLIAIE